jgi:hypothetical protein
MQTLGPALPLAGVAAGHAETVERRSGGPWQSQSVPQSCIMRNHYELELKYLILDVCGLRRLRSELPVSRDARVVDLCHRPGQLYLRNGTIDVYI